MSSHSDVVRRLAGIDRLWSRAEYSMTDFIARHGQRIPVILYISEGYSGADDLHSISVEDVRETNSQSLTFIGVAGVHWGGGAMAPSKNPKASQISVFSAPKMYFVFRWGAYSGPSGPKSACLCLQDKLLATPSFTFSSSAQLFILALFVSLIKSSQVKSSSPLPFPSPPPSPPLPYLPLPSPFPSVPLSVRLSHSWTVSTWFDVRS